MVSRDKPVASCNIPEEGRWQTWRQQRTAL